MSGYTPEYVRHCIRYMPEIAKLDTPLLAETFVALECNVGPWAAFRYYDLITESHYRVLAGQQEGEDRFDSSVQDWGPIGFPNLTTKGHRRFKLRRKAISSVLNQGEEPNERDREHKAGALLDLSHHLVNNCKADMESRRRWHSNLFEWAEQYKPYYRGERLSARQVIYRKSIFLEGINAGDGSDGIAASAIRRWCFGASGFDRHRPCILCAYPLPFTLINSRPQHYRNGAH